MNEEHTINDWAWNELNVWFDLVDDWQDDDSDLRNYECCDESDWLE